MNIKWSGKEQNKSRHEKFSADRWRSVRDIYIDTSEPAIQTFTMAQSLETFFAEMPVVTKFWLCASFLSTLAVMLKIIHPMVLLLDFDMIWGRFQVTALSFF